MNQGRETSQRAQFEEWARGEFEKANFRTVLHIHEGRTVEVYVTDRVRHAWNAWQEGARRASALHAEEKQP